MMCWSSHEGRVVYNCESGERRSGRSWGGVQGGEARLVILYMYVI
jgi:hypothetical protein